MPKVLGRYHIISELGRGGMGVVYKAVDPKLERFIAIKCLSDELSRDEITVSRFLREARNVAALNHPHIAQIFLADEDEGKPYFVMEYIDGESLAERLARDKRLMPEQALRIVAECAAALRAAHEENIIHRDIKPGNIMLDRRGRTVLTDFGIASIVHPDSQPKSNKFIMGTPGYLPPEVMTGQPADHRGDIFALGAVFYEMLVGKRLVPGSGIEDTARTLLAKDFPELGDLDEQVDDFTFGVLGRMLAPDPEKRFQNYDDLLAGLRSEQAAVAPLARTDSGVEPTRLSGSSAPEPDGPPTPVQPPPETAQIDSGAARPPPTEVSPPPAGRSRVARYSMVTALVLGLCVIGLGLARLIPERWDQVTALFDSSSDQAAVTDLDSDDAADAGSGAPIDNGRDSGLDNRLDQRQPSRLVAGEPIADDVLASSARLPYPEGTEPAASMIESARPEPLSEPPATVPTTPPIDSLARTQVLESEAVASQNLPESRAVPAAPPPERATASLRSAVPADPEPAMPAEPAVSEAQGVLVIGQGDPVFVDPMIRAVEEELHAAGLDIIERGFVSGLAGLTAGDEVDLAGLSRVATAAGARYAVVLRAMPAGQRELSYYGRSDTLFVVQTETITYDLIDRRRLGSSALEQIDYTALNATARARQSIAPRLASIRHQLAR